MRARSQAVTSFAACAILIAYIAYAFVVPPEWARKRDPAEVKGPSAAELLEPLQLNATFTTAGRINFEDLTLTFKYPDFWEYGELHSDQVDATVRVIRPGSTPVHAGITLLVTRSPAALHAPKPLLPPGTKLLTEQRRPFGTTEMIFAEFVTTTPLKDYQHGMTLESTDSTRYVSLVVGCHGPPGSSDVVDRQFEELRATFDAVLSSLRFEPGRPNE